MAREGLVIVTGMRYLFLAQLVIAIHFVWILFLIFGFIFAFRGSKIAFLHIAGLLFSVFLNILGWYCPLTYLENFLVSLYNPSYIFQAPFVAGILDRLIYPDLPEKMIRIGEIVFVCFYAMIYIYYARKHNIVGHFFKVLH